MRKVISSTLLLGSLLISNNVEEAQGQRLRGKKNEEKAAAAAPPPPVMPEHPVRKHHDYEHRGISQDTRHSQNNNFQHRDLHDNEDHGAKHHHGNREKMMEQQHLDRQTRWQHQHEKAKDEDAVRSTSGYQPQSTANRDLEKKDIKQNRLDTIKQYKAQSSSIPAKHSKESERPAHVTHQNHPERTSGQKQSINNEYLSSATNRGQSSEHVKHIENKKPNNHQQHQFVDKDKDVEIKPGTVKEEEDAPSLIETLQDLLEQEQDLREESEELAEQEAENSKGRPHRLTKAEKQDKKEISEIDETIKKLQQLLEEHHLHKEQQTDSPGNYHSDLRLLLDNHERSRDPRNRKQDDENVKEEAHGGADRIAEALNSFAEKHGHGHRSGYSDPWHQDNHHSKHSHRDMENTSTARDFPFHLEGDKETTSSHHARKETEPVNKLDKKTHKAEKERITHPHSSSSSNKNGWTAYRRRATWLDIDEEEEEEEEEKEEKLPPPTHHSKHNEQQTKLHSKEGSSAHNAKEAKRKEDFQKEYGKKFSNDAPSVRKLTDREEEIRKHDLYYSGKKHHYQNKEVEKEEPVLCPPKRHANNPFV